MPRSLRHDYPGARQHVFNQGIGHRAIFENAQDVGFFLFLVGRAVQEGLLEVHAYCVMTTHFHLLVTSPQGRLDEAMQHIQDVYARWFNRTRRRNGGVFRDRYRSKVIEDTKYWEAVLWYIDRNAVEAGLVAKSYDYPYGSAAHYRGGGGPSWLNRAPVERTAAMRLGGHFDASRYGEWETGPRGSRLWLLLDGQLRSSASTRDFRDLVGAAPAFVRDWLRDNAVLADGAPSGTLLLHPDTLGPLIQRMRAADPGRSTARRKEWDQLEAGLRHGVAGMVIRDIAAVMERSQSVIHTHIRAHGERLRADEAYRDRAAVIVQAGLERDYAPLRDPVQA
jgi:REP element-mobilizing transposase RayT